MSHILYPERFESAPRGGEALSIIENRAEQLGDVHDEPSTVVIRTKNDRDNIERLFEEIDSQFAHSEPEVILVDTESTDGTVDIAKSYGATVLTIAQADFTYPKSLNMGMEAASNDHVLLTVGHANLSNDKLLMAASQRLGTENMAAAFGVDLPGHNASFVEHKFGFLGVMSRLRKTGEVDKYRFGDMGATRTAISKEAWKELGGFDLRYAAGGEDGDMLKRMIEARMHAAYEPLLSVHHSHGLGPINFAKQAVHWAQIAKGPGSFDERQLLARRPDLRQKKNGTSS